MNLLFSSSTYELYLERTLKSFLSRMHFCHWFHDQWFYVTSWLLQFTFILNIIYIICLQFFFFLRFYNGYIINVLLEILFIHFVNQSILKRGHDGNRWNNIVYYYLVLKNKLYKTWKNSIRIYYCRLWNQKIRKAE